MKNDPNSSKQKSICSEVQLLLFDYMNRELGPGRSDLVREHVRKCAICQAESAEIQATLDLLRSASRAQTNIPSHLSDKHRARIVRSVMHPVLDWMSVHHVLVSLLVAAVILTAWAFFVCRIRIAKIENDQNIGPVYTITIATPQSNDLQEVPQEFETLPVEPLIDGGLEP